MGLINPQAVNEFFVFLIKIHANQLVQLVMPFLQGVHARFRSACFYFHSNQVGILPGKIDQRSRYD
jgi:hypothetical protein